MTNRAALVLALLFLGSIVPAADADVGAATILDFHSQSCPPCRKMRPEMEILRRAKYPIQSIDVDQQPDWAERYQVSEVPTFIVVDDQGNALARTKGYQPARQIADLYNQSQSRMAPANANAHDDADDDHHAVDEITDDPRRTEGAEITDRDATEQASNPLPWKTIVRFKIDDPHTRRIGFGSGTVIDSNDQESLILTCAHLFKIENSPRQYRPSEFPLPITVELFDGNGRGPNMKVLPIQEIPGKVVDYNFATDVALVKIRPGRKLPFSKVVPSSWKPQANMSMTTVGCSLGKDPTAWTTRILRPVAQGPDPNYRGMECLHAPKQGRSGGGIFTADGYVAGVCDFATVYDNKGLYARPESIHAILDRNRLTALYNPKIARDTLVAGNNVRGRSIDPETRQAPRTQAQPNARAERPITIPKPELLGIASPTPEIVTVGAAWKATPVSHPRSAERGPRVEFEPIAELAQDDRVPAPVDAGAARSAGRRTTIPPIAVEVEPTSVREPQSGAGTSRRVAPSAPATPSTGGWHASPTRRTDRFDDDSRR